MFSEKICVKNSKKCSLKIRTSLKNILENFQIKASWSQILVITVNLAGMEVTKLKKYKTKKGTFSEFQYQKYEIYLCKFIYILPRDHC